jgi:hypothetical protein
MAATLTGEAQHRLGKHKTDVVLQALAQPIAPVGVAIRMPCMPAHPKSPVIPQLDGGYRGIVRPEIESSAAGKIEPGMMPMASQYAILDRAAMQRETEMRATVVEREDSTVVVYDEQRTGAAMHDLHTAGLELVQRPYADPIIGPRRLWVLLAGLGHGRLDPLPPPNTMSAGVNL